MTTPLKQNAHPHFRSAAFGSLYRKAIKAGWVPYITGKEHLSLRSPSGEIVRMSQTAFESGDVLKKMKSQFRKGGLDV